MTRASRLTHEHADARPATTVDAPFRLLFAVLSEFSMRQPPGWFEEYRGQFSHFVAADTITVEG